MQKPNERLWPGENICHSLLSLGENLVRMQYVVQGGPHGGWVWAGAVSLPLTTGAALEVAIAEQRLSEKQKLLNVTDVLHRERNGR